MAGSAFVMLLKDIDFEALSVEVTFSESLTVTSWALGGNSGALTFSSVVASSSRFTLSREASDVCEIECWWDILFSGVEVSFVVTGPSTCPPVGRDTSSSLSEAASSFSLSFSSAGGRTSVFRFVSDLTDPVSTASSNVS